MQEENGRAWCAGQGLRVRWTREQQGGGKRLLEGEGGEKGQEEEQAQHGWRRAESVTVGK